MIQFVDVSDNNITGESLLHLLSGVRCSQNLVSLNLSQNDIGGSGQQAWDSVIGILGSVHEESEWVHCESLEELSLASNNLTNKHLEELSAVIRICARTKLHRLDLSYNKLGVKGILNMLQALRANMHMKITHLNFDKAALDPGTTQEKIHNYYLMLRVLSDYLRVTKHLRSLSMNGC